MSAPTGLRPQERSLPGFRPPDVSVPAAGAAAVTLRVPGNPHPLILDAILAAESSDTLEIAFGRPAPGTLHPGAVGELETSDGTLLPVQVIAIEGGDPAAAVLRPLIVASTVEERKAQRAITVNPLETPVMAMSNGRLTTCRVVLIDLSAGGAGLIAPKPLDVGTVLGINPPPLDGLPDIDMAAEIVWRARLGRFWRIGTRFTGVTSEQQSLLLRRVEAEERRWVTALDALGT